MTRSLLRARRGTALLSVLGVLALSAGCSSSDSDDSDDRNDATPTAASTATGPSAATGGEPAPADDLTARVQALAEAVNLRAGDLPGFQSTPPDEDDDEDPPGFEDATKAFAECLELSEEDARDFFDDSEDETSIDSPDFEMGEDVPSLQYSSSTDIDAGSGTESEDFGRVYQLVFSEPGATCFGEFTATVFEGVFSSDPQLEDLDVVIQNRGAELFDVPTGPSQQGAGLSADLLITIDGQEIASSLQLAFLFQGEAVVQLSAQSVDRSVPTDQRDALLQTLSERLAAAAGTSA